MRNGRDNQQRILTYIRTATAEKGYPPSVREICAAVGLRSTSTVHAHLRHLEEQGLLRRDPAKPRALEVMDGSQARGRSVPLVNRKAIGAPSLSMENVEEMLVLPQRMIGQDDVYCLRVSGDSMAGIGILDGDIVAVRQQDTAQSGDVVVAMIDDDATLTRIWYEGDRVRLQPENGDGEPVYADAVTILGKLIALIRAF